MTASCFRRFKQGFLLGLELVVGMAVIGAMHALLPRRVYAMHKPSQPIVATSTPVDRKEGATGVLSGNPALAHKASQSSSEGSGMIPVGADQAEGSGRLSQDLSPKVNDKDLPKATSIRPRPHTALEEPGMSLALDEQSAPSGGSNGEEELMDTYSPHVAEEVPTEDYADRALTRRSQPLPGREPSGAPRQTARPSAHRTTSARMDRYRPERPGIGGPPSFPPPMGMSRDPGEGRPRLPPPEEVVEDYGCSPCCKNWWSKSEASRPAPVEEIRMVESTPRWKASAQREAEPTEVQKQIRLHSNEICWEKGWIRGWPSDPAAQREELKQFVDLPAAEGPRFHGSIKEQVVARAQEVGLPLDDQTFVHEHEKTTLTAYTYAPQKFGAFKGLKKSRRRDNREQRVGILHARGESGLKVDIYARRGLDHGGEMDLYAGRRGNLPCIAHADQDTGLVFESSKAKLDRWVED